MRRRAPRHPALRMVVQTIWASEAGAVRSGRERVIPTGSVHLVLRLDEEPLRLYSGSFEQDPVGRPIATAIVGGLRDTAWIRDVSVPVTSVGAQLVPGAAPLLLGVPADVLRGGHLDLGSFWGRAAAEMQERLLCAEPAARLDLFERMLLERMDPARTILRGISAAVAHLERSTDVAAAVQASGWSHRHFIRRFREATGLLPGDYARLRRLHRSLRLRSMAPRQGWAEVAVAAGFSDQAHMSREFRRITGLPPSDYEQLAAAPSLHVPIGGGVKFLQDVRLAEK